MNRVDVNLNKKDSSEKPDAENRYVIFHELLHALGFEHEQFHKGYPWDDSELPASSALDQDTAVRANLQAMANLTLFDELKKAYGSGLAPVQYLASRKKNLANDKLNTRWGECDVNSILMYPAHKKILAEKFPEMAAEATQKVGSGLVSAGDIAALRVIYPSVG